MKKSIIFPLLIFILSGLGSAHGGAQGVMLSPTRVILEGRQRATTVRMINPNNMKQSYRVSLVAMRMGENGSVAEVASPTPKEAAVLKMIRYSPRRAQVGPHGWQTIRLMARKPAHLPPGEYRAHLKVVPIPATPQATPQKTSSVSVSLGMVFGISIPIIIRHGEGEAKLAIHHPCLIQEGDKTYLEAQLTRGGNHSAYFDFSASQVQNGEKIELASRRGMAIYAPNGSRRVRAKIKEGIGISDGPILIELHDREKKDHALLGEWTFTLDEI